jgi:hypothetical protein
MVSLAGCSDDDSGPGPTVTTAVATTAPPTSAPTVQEPTKPVAKRTPESAVAFVRYFVALYNYAYATADVKTLGDISETDCAFCRALIDDARSRSERGAVTHDAETQILEAASPPVKITDRAVVVASIRQNPGWIFEPTGKRIVISGFKSLRSTFGLSWTGAGWSVHGVENDAGTRVPW